MYSALDIADYVIKYCDENKLFCSNLKLQKILYFLQAEFLVARKQKLFEEPIVAWDFGPVVKEVYMKYRAFGGGLIPGLNINFPPICIEDTVLIDKMLEKLNDYSTSSLVEITLHQDPWKKNYSRYFEREIPAEDIYNFFKD